MWCPVAHCSLSAARARVKPLADYKRSRYSPLSLPAMRWDGGLLKTKGAAPTSMYVRHESMFVTNETKKVSLLPNSKVWPTPYSTPARE